MLLECVFSLLESSVFIFMLLECLTLLFDINAILSHFLFFILSAPVFQIGALMLFVIFHLK